MVLLRISELGLRREGKGVGRTESVGLSVVLHTPHLQQHHASRRGEKQDCEIEAAKLWLANRAKGFEG